MSLKKKRMFRRSDPATKGDLQDLRKDVRSMDTGLRSDFEKRLSETEYRILEQMTLVLEHHREEIVGANRDEIEVLKDHEHNHERRIKRLEKVTGVAA